MLPGIDVQVNVLQAELPVGDQPACLRPLRRLAVAVVVVCFRCGTPSKRASPQRHDGSGRCGCLASWEDFKAWLWSRAPTTGVQAHVSVHTDVGRSPNQVLVRPSWELAERSDQAGDKRDDWEHNGGLHRLTFMQHIIGENGEGHQCGEAVINSSRHLLHPQPQALRPQLLTPCNHDAVQVGLGPSQHLKRADAIERFGATAQPLILGLELGVSQVSVIDKEDHTYDLGNDDHCKSWNDRPFDLGEEHS
mmetsp:Transcript_9866/g.24539  ORF Transcript_9866/g.24539 Transcript_9866/m.24539 type:complete len:249 (-) Transcript_9866:898-1644(-)